MAAPSTSLIIPAYNEGDRLAAGFRRLEVAAQEGRVDLDDLKVIYVDDGSRDSTAEVAASLAARLPHGRVLIQSENRGKGAAVRMGVAAADTPRLVFTDADMAIDPRQVPALLAALDHAPMAVGSRAVNGHIDYGSPLRTLAGRTFNQLVRALSDVELRDTQCGFKALSSPHAKILFHLTGIDGFAFDVEVLSRTRMLGWPVVEVPVSWSDVGGSHVRLARDSAEMLRDLASARFRSGHLPSVPALTGIAVDDFADIAAEAAGTSLAAAPVLIGPDDKVTVLAALVDGAQGVLEDLRSRVGGVVASVLPRDIGAAASISALLPPP